MSDIKKEVQKALIEQSDNIPLEEIPAEESSPLNQPVVEKDIAGHVTIQTEETTPITDSENLEAPEGNEPETLSFSEDDSSEDAPEQEINSNYEEADLVEKDEAFELSTSHAKQAADSLLGITNNVLGIGGGFFVKIRKHKEFYDFEEVIQLIDDQNEKNIARIKLDEEDKALLRPLLIAILKKRAKQLTPEQQLLGAVISILMKKAQVVMEVRAENKILEERFLDIVREFNGGSPPEPAGNEQPTTTNQPPEIKHQESETPAPMEIINEEIEMESDSDVPPFSPEELVELAVDEPEIDSSKEKEQ